MAAVTKEGHTLTYICTGAMVQGLPTRGFYKPEGRYCIRVTIDGKDEWGYEEVRTRGSTIAWDGEKNKHKVKCTPTSRLRVTLSKTQSSRLAEELGTAELSLIDWLEAKDATPLVPSPNSRLTPSSRVALFLAEESKMPAKSETVPLPLRQRPEIAGARAEATHPKPGLDKLLKASDKVDVRDLSAEVDIQRIPYVNEAGYEGVKRCLPGTRIALLDEITEWANSKIPDTPRVFVLMGPAGIGKSTIAHTVASRFRETHQLGSIFCFSTIEAVSRTPECLFRNIAHDLCKRYAPFKIALCKSIKNDRHSSTTTDPDTQFARLLLDPARMLVLNGIVLVVVDALDESGTVRERAKLLSVLTTRLGEVPVAFRFLITCRPERDILQNLSRSTTSAHIRLVPTLDQDPNLSGEILMYIRHKLSQAAGTLPIDLDDRCCEQLRDRAEGLFQWASVACDYISGGPAIGEAEYTRYEKVIDGTRGRCPLDSLYKTILSPLLKDMDALRLFKIVMGFVLLTVEPLSKTSLNEMLLLLPTGDPLNSESLKKDTILPLLASLLSGVPEDNVPIRPLHSSFTDLLCDPDRGGPYFIDTEGHHERLVVASLGLLTNRLHFNMGDLQDSYVLNRDVRYVGQFKQKVSEGLSYACRHWGYHLSVCAPGFEEQDLVGALVRQLMMEKLLFWFDAASIAGVVADLTPCLYRALSRLPAMGDDTLTMASDAIRFLRRFGRPIAGSAAHIYISALVWLPTTSKVAQTYGRKYLQTARVVVDQPVSWPFMEIAISGQAAPVYSVAFSPDGKRIASGSWDRTIRIWNAETGEAIGKPLSGHNTGVFSVAFSPNGKWIASGSWDKTIRIWNAETGEAIGQPLSGHTGQVNSVAFSSDSQRIASGADDRTVRIWDVDRGKAVGEPLSGHADLIKSVAFSPDGHRIASGSRDNTIRIWNAQTGEPIGHPLSGHAFAVTSVVFSPDSKRIVSGSFDRTLRIWNAETGAAIGRPLTGHSRHVKSVAISPEGNWIVSGCWENTIRIWNAETGEMIGKPLAGHTDQVNSVAFSFNGQRIVSGSEDRTIRVWDVQTAVAMSQSFSGHDDDVRAVAFSPNSKRILSGSSDNTIRMWNVETGEVIGLPFFGHTKSVSSVTFSPDGERIVSGSWDRTIRIWNVETGKAIGRPLFGHTDLVHCVTFSPDGKRIASGSQDKTIRIWDAETGKAIIRRLSGHTYQVNSVAFSPEGKRIVSGSWDQTIRIWSAETGEAIGQPLSGHTGKVNSVAFSPDGKRIVSCSRDKTIRIWNADTGEAIGQMLPGHTQNINSVAFSPDGKRIASSSWDRTVRLWNSETGEAIGAPLSGHTDLVYALAFSPDGRRIVSCSSDKTVRIWSAGTKVDEVLREAPVSVHPNSAALSREGRRIITSDPVDKTIQSSDAEPGEPPTGQVRRTWSPNLTGSGLSLSPAPEHQLTQPYIPAIAEEAVISFDLDSGWIMGNGEDYILWVPPDEMLRLYTGQTEVVIPGPTIHVDLSRFAHGTRWTDCCRPLH